MFARKLSLVLLVLVALLPLLGRTQPTPPLERNLPPLDDPVIQSCIVEAVSPGKLDAPEYCGWGVWLPAEVYQDMHAWNLIGKDCEANTKSEVEKEKARARRDARILEVERDSYKQDLDSCRSKVSPNVLSLLWKGSIAGVTGGGIGAISGLAVSFVPGIDLDWDRSLGIGFGIGAVSSIISVLMYELLR